MERLIKKIKEDIEFNTKCLESIPSWAADGKAYYDGKLKYAKELLDYLNKIGDVWF